MTDHAAVVHGMAAGIGGAVLALLLEVARLPLETLRDTTGWPGAQRWGAGWMAEAPDAAGVAAVVRDTSPDASL